MPWHALTRRQIQTRRRWAIIVLASLLFVGCTEVHPRLTSGTGTYMWLTQRLIWLYPFPLEEVRKATFAALSTLQYEVSTQQFDGLGGQLVARPLVGPLAHIEADPLSSRITKVQVRVPGTGGRSEAERIHATIRSELGM
jgi:hypothetical protein